MRTKTLRWLNLILLISLLSLALGSCDGSPPDDDPPSNTTTGTITGTVSGTEIIAVDDSGAIVASDNTTGKTPDASGNYPFTLTGIPVGVNIRVYLITGSGVYPLYFGAPSTNIFSLSAVADIDLGFVDTTGGGGQAIPENDPTAIAGVSAEAENTTTLVLVTDENTGAPLSGATVIVDHVLDPRQVATTTAAGSASFTPSSAGPVTITVGKSGYELVTFVDYNLVFLKFSLKPMDSPGLSAFVEGTAANFIGPMGVILGAGGGGDLNKECPTCEDLGEGTLGFYKLVTDRPNQLFNLSAIDFDSDLTTPINFTAITGIGPLTDGQTLTVDMIFPASAPATATTTGTITVPANLGTIDMVIAAGGRDLVGDPGELFVGLTVDITSPSYDYTLTTFDFAEGGTSTSIMAIAEGTLGGSSHSVKRGVGFGGNGVDFSLIDVPIIQTPTGFCDVVAPTISWSGVTGVSFYVVNLNDADTNWDVVTGGGTTSFTLPDLTGTALAGLGLTTGNPVGLSASAMVVPDFNFNSLINKDTIMMTFADISESPGVSCTPCDPTVISGDTIPSAPQNIQADAADSQVTIGWDPVCGASQYNLYMATESGVTPDTYNTLPGGMVHENVTSPYTPHTDLTNGTAYYFVVTAINAVGGSPPSDEVPAIPGNTVCYVSSTAPDDSGDCRSPATACLTIPAAIAACNAPAEVRVNAGTFNVNSDITGTPTHVVLSEGVSLYGGYAADFSERDPAVNITTITDNSSNSDQINSALEAGTSISNATIVDGFVLNGSTQPGAGFTTAVWVHDGSAPMVRNNTLNGGSGDNFSLGMANFGSSPIVLNNTLNGGSSSDSSFGMLNQTSSPIVRNNTLNGGSGGASFGMFNDTSSTPTIENNIIFTSGTGGTICIYEADAGSDPDPVRNNNLFGCSTALYVDEDSVVITNIADVNNLNDTTASGNVSINPMFIDLDGGDWHFKSDGSSPCSVTEGGLNGTGEGWSFTDDKEGITRTSDNSGTGWSMGAYEFDGACTP